MSMYLQVDRIGAGIENLEREVQRALPEEVGKELVMHYKRVLSDAQHSVEPQHQVLLPSPTKQAAWELRLPESHRVLLPRYIRTLHLVCERNVLLNGR